jgi:hypothetical protein
MPSPSDDRFQDTWLWPARNWLAYQPATVPPTRFAEAMAFDETRGNLVMFGGFSTFAQNDTWILK